MAEFYGNQSSALNHYGCDPALPTERKYCFETKKTKQKNSIQSRRGRQTIRRMAELKPQAPGHYAGAAERGLMHCEHALRY